MSALIPSLNWLRVFEASARHQSFARAGKELNMSAAAVSQQVLALETHLGRALFERAANRISLTAEGRDFLPTVQVSLGAIESKAASIFGKQRVERVALLASQLMAMSWLPRVLAEFERENPSICVDLMMEGTQRKTEPDLAIRFGEEPHLVRHPNWLMGMSHVVMCRKEDAPKITDLESLLSFRLFDVISHAMGWTALLTHNFGPMQGRNLMLESVDTTPLALMMVSQGLGIAIGHVPVCGPLAASLNLGVCSFVPKTPGPGNYYLEQSVNRPGRAATLHLERALQAAAQTSMRAP
ncbi:LysR family transcriptional regulator [Mesorhizobium sp. M8A.F.Ca.ET.208.01.1.1]|uniref:LysR family transcriptional regulator n=1 Tax=unclassified Mesorhizobium TaxID=325217 RepID=UPI00109356A2|nr:MULTISPECIES: LysR family transcriptional regulator [unclassified Mesorhizobium]TGU40201.1 LysR family transcriptional regulator [bacterium M00.F.Ca.ET.156.01.1.1]TGQ89218.1 LysR family transcriptional regulator [Mesorhizobium sp. M8A.F.Ca.ET.208.01.1.1]TGR32322.1 LysR family transcriptional regulator [Mesorhizobium sp. M8A.F.Ca.ET.202.01.1.1]TGT50538.1 LysR family transcriptional regulator [Mesorhizobium sp. M8A.F.Ca.ET.167.01.1.1]TIT34005.1 MAG: LysR family transcriptional regulator [Meso